MDGSQDIDSTRFSALGYEQILHKTMKQNWIVTFKHHYMRWILNTILIGYACTCPAAYFSSLAIENGLSQGTIYDIVQDKHGFIWIATGDGLNRYDGIEFKHFKITDKSQSPSALSHSYIAALNSDSNGNLWINTKNGLNYFDTTTYETKHFLSDPNNPKSITRNDIYSSTFDSNGYLWMRDKTGILRMNTETGEFKHYVYQANSSNYNCSPIINNIYADNQNRIWLASSNNLCRFDTKSEKFEFIDYRNDPIKSASYAVADITQENEYLYWIGSRYGLIKYNDRTKESTVYMHDPDKENSLVNNTITRITPYGEKYLWIATVGGLSLFNTQNNTFTNFNHSKSNKNGLNANHILSVFIDQSGLIWIGSNGSGINIYNPRQLAFNHINDNSGKKSSLSNPSVWGFNKAYGYLWIGTSKGLNRFDINTGEIKHYLSNPKNPNSLIGDIIYDVFPGNNRDLWIASWKGLSRFYVEEERFENYRNEPGNPNSLPSNNILALYYDKEIDKVWMSSNGMGLMTFNPKTKSFASIKSSSSNINGPSHNYITTISKTSKHHIWFSTREGFDRYDIRTGNFEHITQKTSLTNSDAFDIKRASTGKLLISSDDGLIIFDPNTYQIIKTFTIQDGLNDDLIYSIEEDNNGYYWVGTNLGISRINPMTNEIINFDISDGLQGYEFNSSASFNDGEYLYFGGYNGFNYFKPEHIVTGTLPPPLAITSFSIQGNEMDTHIVNSPLEISYKDSFFAIEFAALDYTNPKKNQYAYMLEGFDNEWNYNGNRNFVSYTNLDGGNYIFKVKAANKYGIWNEKGISIPINIIPPYWKTNWFRFSSAVFTVLIIFAIYALRVRSIKIRNKVLKEEVKNRTHELEETLVELTETKDALIDAAHKAGMADTATGVLHNIGNILNNVSISAGVMRELLLNSTCNKLLKANEVVEENLHNLDEFISNDPRVKKLLQYYLQLGKSFKKENNLLDENALRLIEKITSITEVITAQQRYAQGYDFIEELSLADVINDTIMLQASSFDRHSITIKKAYDNTVPNVSIQKIKVVQILLNLFKNAKEAMNENKSNNNILIIEVSQDDEHAYIKVTDTGIGIQRDMLKQIFNHGFTTKSNGYGFGLHSCANYMTEMQGKMWADSEGAGNGATFILQFPLKAKDCRIKKHAA